MVPNQATLVRAISASLKVPFVYSLAQEDPSRLVLTTCLGVFLSVLSIHLCPFPAKATVTQQQWASRRKGCCSDKIIIKEWEAKI